MLMVAFVQLWSLGSALADILIAIAMILIVRSLLVLLF